jgi:hypothetical protein
VNKPPTVKKILIYEPGGAYHQANIQNPNTSPDSEIGTEPSLRYRNQHLDAATAAHAIRKADSY